MTNFSTRKDGSAVRVSISGSVKGRYGVTFQDARMIGAWLAESGHEVASGACPGYPDEVIQGYLEAGGARAVGFSPFGDEELHRQGLPLPGGEFYPFPLREGMEMNFTGRGGGRNDDIVRWGEVLLAFPGETGTANEIFGALSYGRQVVVIGLEFFKRVAHAVEQLSPKSQELVFGADSHVYLSVLFGNSIKSPGPYFDSIKWSRE